MAVVAMILFVGLSAFLGYRVISAVPPLLHTPLMSGMNALSGITLLAALLLLGPQWPAGVRILAALAAILAAINAAGGFWLTERMLRLFKKQKDVGGEDNS